MVSVIPEVQELWDEHGWCPQMPLQGLSVSSVCAMAFLALFLGTSAPFMLQQTGHHLCFDLWWGLPASNRAGTDESSWRAAPKDVSGQGSAGVTLSSVLALSFPWFCSPGAGEMLP